MYSLRRDTSQIEIRIHTYSKFLSNESEKSKEVFCCASYDLLTDGRTIGQTFLFFPSPETNPVVPHGNKEFAIGIQKPSSGTAPCLREN